MSYVTGTTHYNLPQTVGTDKRDWADTNQAFADIDAAIYGAVEDVATASTDISGLKDRMDTAEGNITQAQSDITGLDGRLTTAEQTIVAQGNEIGDVKSDTQDMICAYSEPTATSTHDYDIGDYFRYNDVLYRATQSITIGDTIVPDTNCTTTNVTTELLNIDDLSGDVEQLQADVAGLVESVETSTTSAHAYAIGDKFMLNHVEYITIKPISIGDTLNSLNCSSDTHSPFVVVEVLNDGVKTFGDALTAIRAYLPNVSAFDPKCYNYHINFGNVIDCYYAGFDTNAVWQFTHLSSGTTVESGVAYFNTNVAKILSQNGDFTSGVMNSPLRLVYVP